MNRVVLVMITRDDSRHVERAIRSARPHVDEVLVLDLGSYDDTVARAENCGARVVSAAWDDDPSLVWNHALALAGGDWHVVLEPHEWIDAGAQVLAELMHMAPDVVGLVEVVPGAAARGLDAPSLQARLLPAHVRFAGRFRPEPVYPGARTWRSPVIIASDDAQFSTWAQDRALLGAAVSQALSVQPDDPRLLAEMGRWQRAEGDHSAAAGSFARAADVVGPEIVERHAYVVETLDALRAARRFRDALALVDAEKANWADSADFSYVVGDLFFEMILAEPSHARQLGPLVESCWRRCLTIGDRPELPGALTGRGSFLAAQSLGVLHLTLGHREESAHWFGKADELRLAAPYAVKPRLLG